MTKVNFRWINGADVEINTTEIWEGETIWRIRTGSQSERPSYVHFEPIPAVICGTGTSSYGRPRTPAHRFGPKMNQAKDNSLLSRLLTVRFNDANVSMEAIRDLRTTTFFAGLGKNCSEQSDPWIPESNMEVLFYFSVNENWRLVRIDKSGKAVCQK